MGSQSSGLAFCASEPLVALKSSACGSSCLTGPEGDRDRRCCGRRCVAARGDSGEDGVADHEVQFELSGVVRDKEAEYTFAGVFFAKRRNSTGRPEPNKFPGAASSCSTGARATAHKTNLWLGRVKSVIDIPHNERDPVLSGEVNVAEATSDVPPPKDGRILPKLKRQCSVSLQIMIENEGAIGKIYAIEKQELGKGAFGSVRQAKVKATGASRAVKFISKARMKGKEGYLKQEIEIMKLLDHPNIIKLYEIFEDWEQIYLVMEFCIGGAVLERIVRAGRFLEAQAASVMHQILRAVFYMHEHWICHRDIKPANCLVANRNAIENNSVRVTDFGFACRFKKNQALKERVGTLAYMSPQVLARSYDQSCDIWACGVTMYHMLCGYVPFSSKNEDDMKAKISKGHLKFDPPHWVDVSEDGMRLLRKMLQVKPSDRCCVEYALDSEWLRKNAAEAKRRLSFIETTIVANLVGFRSLNKFKRASLHIIASLLDEDQIRDSRSTFIFLDRNGDGLLTIPEIKAAKAANADDEGAALAAEGAQTVGRALEDEDATPYSYTEFVAATFDRRLCRKKDICWAAFNFFDANKDGTISQEELSTGASVLGPLTPAELESLVRGFDRDADGTIDFEEFCQMLRDGEGWAPMTPREPSSGKKPQLRRSSSGNSVATVGSSSHTTGHSSDRDFGSSPPGTPSAWKGSPEPTSPSSWPSPRNLVASANKKLFEKDDRRNGLPILNALLRKGRP